MNPSWLHLKLTNVLVYWGCLGHQSYHTLTGKRELCYKALSLIEESSHTGHGSCPEHVFIPSGPALSFLSGDVIKSEVSQLLVTPQFKHWVNVGLLGDSECGLHGRYYTFPSNGWNYSQWLRSCAADPHRDACFKKWDDLDFLEKFVVCGDSRTSWRRIGVVTGLMRRIIWY